MFALNKCVSVFLDKVCGQIKYKGVHEGISEELESHVNERIDFYVEAGLDEDEASIKAVEQMGDPVKIGQELNKTHRPKTEWSIIGLISVMVIVGIISVYTLAKDPGYYLDREGLVKTYLLQIIMGSSVFLTFYFLDYKKMERYSLHFLLGTLAFLFVGHSLFFRDRLGSYSLARKMTSLALPFLIISVSGLIKRWCTGNKIDMFKLMGLIGATIIFMLIFTNSLSLTAGLVATILISITAAILRKGFKGNREKWLVFLYGSGTAGIIFTIMSPLLYPWQLERLKAAFNPEAYDYSYGWLTLFIRDLLSNSKMWGESSSLHYTLEGVDRIYLPSANTDLIFVYIVSAFGWIVGIIVALIVFGAIYRMFLTSKKIKDEYGKSLAISVMSIFSVQAVSNILMNLGVFPFFSVSLPFISQGGTNFVMNMALMGLLLGVFRRKDLVTVISSSSKSLT